MSQQPRLVGSVAGAGTETDSLDDSDLADSEDEGLGPVSQACGRFVSVRLDLEQELCVFALVLHFMHPVTSALTYITWISTAEDELGDTVVAWYRVLTILAAVTYIFVSSVFYMWAFRFHDTKKLAHKRRVLGTVINLFLADTPLFILEVDIVWKATWTATPFFTFDFIVTILSFAFSALRTWIWVMHRYLRSEERARRREKQQEQFATLPGFRRAGPVSRAGGRRSVATFDDGGAPGWSDGQSVDGFDVPHSLQPRSDLLDAEHLAKANARAHSPLVSASPLTFASAPPRPSEPVDLLADMPPLDPAPVAVPRVGHGYAAGGHPAARVF